MAEPGSEAGARAALARAFSFETITRATAREALIAGVGGTAAIGVLALCARLAVTPLIIAPFGASCVLLFTVPASPLAQPRNVIGGHVLSALVGLVVVALIGHSPVAMALGVGLAIAVMRLTGTVHPPAGADPIVIALAAAPPWWFFAVPAGLGAAILVACAILYHRLVSGLRYPA
jgi:CBS-domain-containing membrane protein